MINLLEQLGGLRCLSLTGLSDDALICRLASLIIRHHKDYVGGRSVTKFGVNFKSLRLITKSFANGGTANDMARSLLAEIIKQEDIRASRGHRWHEPLGNQPHIRRYLLIKHRALEAAERCNYSDPRSRIEHGVIITVDPQHYGATSEVVRLRQDGKRVSYLLHNIMVPNNWIRVIRAYPTGTVVWCGKERMVLNLTPSGLVIALPDSHGRLSPMELVGYHL